MPWVSSCKSSSSSSASRAVVQRGTADAERIDVEIAQLRAELVDATDNEVTRTR